MLVRQRRRSCWQGLAHTRVALHSQIECRGLVLDERNNWSVVAMPYYRFFNHGERHADTLDWATARVMDKADGTLVILVRRPRASRRHTCRF